MGKKLMVGKITPATFLSLLECIDSEAIPHKV